jgi:hypothetical protein
MVCGSLLPLAIRSSLVTVADCAPVKRALVVPVPRHQTCIGTCIRALDWMPYILYLAHPFVILFGVDGTLETGAHTFYLGCGTAGDQIPSLGAFVTRCRQGFVALLAHPFPIYCWLLEAGKALFVVVSQAPLFSVHHSLLLLLFFSSQTLPLLRQSCC